MSCDVSSWSAQTFAYVQLISWVVTLFIYAASITKDTRTGRWGIQLTLKLFGAWLFAWQFVVYIFQVAFNTVRPSPFCPSDITYGFPSVAAFYAAAGCTFVVGFVWWRRIQFPYTMWPCVALVFACPLVLVWFAYNTWQEVLLSLGVGVACTTIFLLVVRHYLMEDYPYTLNQAPFTWLGCIDTWLCTPEQHALTDRLRALRERVVG
jgi:hypothetical protein